MSLATATGSISRSLAASYVDARIGATLQWVVAGWVFSGCIVFTEPSPYELAFIVVLGLSLFSPSFALTRATLGLLVLWVIFIPFALIGAFQTSFTPLGDALIFQFVTIFLFFTTYWIANYLAFAPQERLRPLIAAYTAAAVFSATIGTLGYLGLIPGRDLLTMYGRAKALFNDPNVFGPFLILPAMYALQRILLSTRRRALLAAAVFTVLAIGVFVSFSRAAWGHLALSAVIVYLLNFVLVAQAREKVRMLIVALTGAMVLVIAIGGLLSIPTVQRLFEARTASQSYDEGETGRFGRQGYALELALENPLGIGPLEFRNLRIREEPHNTYVNVLHVYGWGGGFAFIMLIGITAWRGVSFLARPSPNRPLLIPLVAVFIPLSLEAAIIDLDHWRHFFLVAGLIWGVTAGYDKAQSGETGRLAGVI